MYNKTRRTNKCKYGRTRKVGDKDIKHWVSSFMFENANIDTGYRNKPNRYPVFTTKEGCLQWLKG